MKTLIPLLLMTALCTSAGFAQTDEICEYRGTTYLGNHPKHKSPGWHEVVQGLTHGENGDDNWYITQESPNLLWRIPLSHDLARDAGSVVWINSTLYVSIEDGLDADVVGLHQVPELVRTGYNHFGDPDYFDPDGDGEGWIFIPIEKSGGNLPGAVAVFKAPSLEFWKWEEVQLPPESNTHAPWAAFDSAGYLYTSQRRSSHQSEFVDPTRLNKWRVNWETLAREGDYRSFLTKVGEVTLLGRSPVEAVCDGAPIPYTYLSQCDETLQVAPRDQMAEIGLEIPQGADFSDDDRMLYIANGWGYPGGRCLYRGFEHEGDPDSLVTLSGCGVHAFQVQGAEADVACSSVEGDCFATRVDRSSNGKGPFNFQYNPGFPDNLEEPEGVDWFDLDAGDAPDIPGFTQGSCTDPDTGAVLDPCPVSGQLHVILLDDDVSNSDEIYIKHYRVDRACTDVAGAALDVIPRSHDFGDVLLGGAARTSLELHNSGNEDLMILEITLHDDSGPDYRLDDLPGFPATIPPGQTDSLTVVFTPTSAGRSTAIVRVDTDLTDHAVTEVPFAAVAIGFPEQVRMLMEFFDQAVAAGVLTGSGAGNAAKGRLGALHNMLDSATDYVEAELIGEACGQLRAVRDRADGVASPPDFATGDAASDLANKTEELRDRMGCQDRSGRVRDAEKRTWSDGTGPRVPLTIRGQVQIVQPGR